MDNSRRSKPFVGGFLLSKARMRSVAHYSESKLPNGAWFYHDDEVAESSSQNGASFVLIRGHWTLAVEDIAQNSVAEYLLDAALRSRAEFEELLELMAGRYVILLCTDGDFLIYNDMVGARTVYYTEQGDKVASHVHLLAEVVGAERVEGAPGMRKLRWVADFTPYQGVYTLLPNHSLSLWEMGTDRFFPRRPNPFGAWSRSARYCEIERIWGLIQRSYFQRFPKVAMSLSGGIDSRLVLAMAKPYWTQLNTYTYGENSTGVDPSISDRDHLSFTKRTMLEDDRIVRQILSSINVKHHTFIDISERGHLGASLEGLIAQNGYGAHGRNLVASYRDVFPGDDWLNVRGNTVELARKEYGDTTFSSLVKMCGQGYPKPVQQRLRQLGFDKDLHGYSRLMLAHWELKDGKWLGEIHNELDAAFDTWIPAGVRRIRDLIASFPEFEREKGIIIRDLIDRNAPELNWPPVNSVDNLYQEWRSMKWRESTSLPERVQVTRPGEKPKILPASYTLQIPSRFVGKNARLRARLCTAPGPGSLAFVVTKDYSNSKARGYFRWAVEVNDRVIAEGDGAGPERELHFTVENLTEGDRVYFLLIFDRDVRTGDSWSRATRMEVQNTTFVRSGSVEGGVQLRTFAI